LKSCLWIESKNQLLPLTSIPNSRCKIRLDNLEFRRIYRDFSFFLGSPLFSYELEVFSWGNLKGLFSNLCFGEDYNLFFSLLKLFEGSEFWFCSGFYFAKCVEVVFPTNFGDVAKLFIVVYLFSLKESGKLFT
jgi:hypothetical protein